uniref:hypothetical protein n=1 Tax=uncultured Allobacillus sp. TaxID=1638025 RepID=UPI002599C077|nr:hypothetical protein [uncultured Allobacillus sp.]
MIVQLKGNVQFPITLDPTVWIFDDRKIKLEEAFSPDKEENAPEKDTEHQQRVRPPVNRSVSRFEGKKVLENSYVMPIKPFLETSSPNEGATSAILHTDQGEVEISLDKLKDSLLIFAIDGKPPKEDGPVHLLFGDGTNQYAPFKGIDLITIN